MSEYFTTFFPWKSIDDTIFGAFEKHVSSFFFLLTQRSKLKWNQIDDTVFPFKYMYKKENLDPLELTADFTITKML